mmetsp:Transcript_15804/g.56206  ORF Transcript_15804/g.56206 Transcript_15804/m.56206 type:complete len:452 (-) Transcript_15804:153-1508(-)
MIPGSPRMTLVALGGIPGHGRFPARRQVFRQGRRPARQRRRKSARGRGRRARSRARRRAERFARLGRGPAGGQAVARRHPLVQPLRRAPLRLLKNTRACSRGSLGREELGGEELGSDLLLDLARRGLGRRLDDKAQVDEDLARGVEAVRIRADVVPPPRLERCRMAELVVDVELEAAHGVVARQRVVVHDAQEDIAGHCDSAHGVLAGPDRKGLVPFRFERHKQRLRLAVGEEPLGARHDDVRVRRPAVVLADEAARADDCEVDAQEHARRRLLGLCAAFAAPFEAHLAVHLAGLPPALRRRPANESVPAAWGGAEWRVERGGFDVRAAEERVAMSVHPRHVVVDVYGNGAPRRCGRRRRERHRQRRSPTRLSAAAGSGAAHVLPAVRHFGVGVARQNLAGCGEAARAVDVYAQREPRRRLVRVVGVPLRRPNGETRHAPTDAGADRRARR